MQQDVENLKMRTTELEKNVLALTTSMASLSQSVQRLVVTLDRGKWLGYGILCMAGVQILGIKDMLKLALGI